MNQELLFALAVSLVLTLLLETGFFLLIGKGNRKDLLLVVLVNIITNPVVVLLYWLAFLHTYLSLVMVKVALELFAIVAEGYYYKKYGQSFSRPYAFSLAANIVSYGSGALVQLFI